MILHPPFQITPSLMAGLKVGEAWVSLEYSKREGGEGRTRYHWQIIFADGQEFNGEDLQSGCGGGSLQSGFVSLLSFLGAAGEPYRHNGNAMGKDSNTDLFPKPVCEWADVNSDELSLLETDIEESKTVLIEE